MFSKSKADSSSCEEMLSDLRDLLVGGYATQGSDIYVRGPLFGDVKAVTREQHCAVLCLGFNRVCNELLSEDPCQVTSEAGVLTILNWAELNGVDSRSVRALHKELESKFDAGGLDAICDQLKDFDFMNSLVNENGFSTELLVQIASVAGDFEYFRIAKDTYAR